MASFTRRHHDCEAGPRSLISPLSTSRWRSLQYLNATWESCHTLLHEQQEMRRYRRSEVPPTAHERRMSASGARPPRTNFKKLDVSWAAAKKMMGSVDGFLQQLQDFDKDGFPGSLFFLHHDFLLLSLIPSVPSTLVP